MDRYRELLDRVQPIVDADLRSEEKMQAVANILHDECEDFDCVAFFLVDPDNMRQLVLGPQSGAGISANQIPVGQGICGQAAERAISIVVDDVSQELNYVPGHPDTRSEIVLPILRGGQVVAELDINSFRLACFDSDVRLFLEEVCLLLTDHI